MPRSIEIGYLSHEVDLPKDQETPHVKRVEIGFDPEYRDRLENVVISENVSPEFLREALTGITFHCSLEHIPRLVQDWITKGRDCYSAQSQRYVTMHLTKEDPSRIHSSSEFEAAGLQNEYSNLAATSIDAYNRLIKLGVGREDARFVFLWSFDCNMVVTLQGPKIVDFAIRNLNSPYYDV
jgi:hypothetical protein